jgi:farnesyl-diphosphate farnesyltransferase
MTDFDRLLVQTSRTFGISIPLLDEPHRRHLTLAYLLFRVADTLEDAEGIPRGQRLAALSVLRAAVSDRTQDRRRACDAWTSWPLSHAGYEELLAQFPELMAAIDGLDEPTRTAIVHHALRTIDGMSRFVDLCDGNGVLHLESLDDLRQYCYVVAGIVGELITDLLVTPGDNRLTRQLWKQAATFGEGLQLVNILRDAADDAQQGRIFLPEKVPVDAVFELARADLKVAEQYVELLRQLNPGGGIVPFAEFPLRLAERTLDRVQLQGAGAKLARSEVAELLLDVDNRLHSRAELPSSLRTHLPTDG